MKEIKPKVQTLIDNWYHDVEFDVIQVWEQDDTWFVVIKYWTHEEAKLIDFVHIFPSYRIKGEYHISVDNTVSV